LTLATQLHDAAAKSAQGRRASSHAVIFAQD
jgi:hypothetical protein